jgi:cytochrome c1
VLVDLVHTTEEQPKRRSELRFRVGVAVLIVLAVLLVLISLGIVRLA